MTKNEIIENEMNGIEVKEEVNEEKIKVLRDYATIIKNIGLVPIKTKYSTFFNVQVQFNGVSTIIKTRCDDDLVNYVKTCTELKKQALKEKALVQEENQESGKIYTCVKLTLTNGKIFRYFVSRADESTIEAIFDDFQEKSKK